MLFMFVFSVIFSNSNSLWWNEERKFFSFFLYSVNKDLPKTRLQVPVKNYGETTFQFAQKSRDFLPRQSKEWVNMSLAQSSLPSFTGEYVLPDPEN